MAALGPESAYIFRITHINNVRWMLRNGIHCRSSDRFDLSFVSIGSAELIEKRRSKPVPVSPGGTLSDYVPFYFTPWSKMLYNITTGRGVPRREKRDIVMVVSSLRKLERLGVRFLFTS